MMSTAILMTMVGAQTSVRPASLDQGQTDGMSFAQSLDERVGASTAMLGERPMGEMTIGTQSVKAETAVKVPNVVATVPHGLKGEAITSHEEVNYGEVKGGVGGKNSAQGGTVPVSPTKMVVRDPEKDLAIEDSSITPPDAKDLNMKGGAFLPQINAVEEEQQPLVQSSEEIVAQKEMPTTETLEVVPAKKTAKSQKDEAEPMSLQKIVTVLHPVAIEARPASGTVALNQVAGQAVMVASTPDIADRAIPKGEINSALDGGLGSGAPVAAKNSLTGPIAMKESLPRKDVAGGKTPGTEVESGLLFASDSTGAVKPDDAVEKLPSGMLVGRDNGTVKMESAAGTVTTVVHTITGSMGGATGFVAPSDASAMKLPTADAGVHTPSLPAGLGEQDRSDVVAGSMEGMPQTLTATPTALEVGIQNGTHGWLKVRAEMTDGGVVNASVSAASTAGQEMLHRELPALTAYLQSEKVAVSAVVVHPTAPELRGGGAGVDGGSGGQTQQGGNDGGGHRKGVTEAAFDGTDQAMNNESLNGIDDESASPLATYVGGGSWLSVRA
jgi:hypothetical protein